MLLYVCLFRCRPGSHRRGYMGHLIKLSNDVTEAMEKGNNAERLKELYQGELTLPHEVL